jgi:hypothetical protein
MPRFCLAFLLCCLIGPSWALQPVVLDSQEQRLSLTP